MTRALECRRSEKSKEEADAEARAGVERPAFSRLARARPREARTGGRVPVGCNGMLGNGRVPSPVVLECRTFETVGEIRVLAAQPLNEA